MDPFKQGMHVDVGVALVDPGGHTCLGVKSVQNCPAGQVKQEEGDPSIDIEPRGHSKHSRLPSKFKDMYVPDMHVQLVLVIVLHSLQSLQNSGGDDDHTSHIEQ
jgi:hypothetical protein